MTDVKWWPGTGLNRRRRPFQGRALPLSYLASVQTFSCISCAESGFAGKGWAAPRTVRCNDLGSISIDIRARQTRFRANLDAPLRKCSLIAVLSHPVVPFQQLLHPGFMSVKKPTRREFLVAGSTAALAAAVPATSSDAASPANAVTAAEPSDRESLPFSAAELFQ